MPRFLGSSIVSGMAGATPAAEGGGVRLDGRLLADVASGVEILSAREVVYARRVALPDTWDVRGHDGVTETDLDQTRTQGASTIFGGGGVWAVQSGGGPIRSNAHPSLTVLDAFGRPTNEYAGLKDVGPDGTLAYCPRFQDGRGLTLRATDGTTTELVPPTIACRDVQVLDRTSAIWRQGNGLNSTLGRPVTPEGICGVPRLVRLPNGEIWLLYWHQDATGERLLLQPFDTPIGNVLTEPGKRDTVGRAMWPAYRPDLRVVDDQTLEATWSITEAEGWANVRRQPFPLTAARVDLRRSAPMVAIGRPLWMGWFRFGASAVPPPGNCEIAVTQGAPLFVTASGQRIAAYAAGNPDGDLDALERAIEAAKVYGLPVLAYWPRALQAGRLPRGASQIGVEAYKLKTESILDYETRVTAAVRRCAAPWLLANVYTSNALNDPDLTLIPPVMARIARNNPNVAGILGFSAGEGRRTGWDDHPEVHEAWRQLVAGIPRAPALPEGTTVKAPGVDVLDWKPIDPDKTGPLISMRDRNNPQAGTVEVFLRNGSIHATWSNAAGSNTTGVTRKVI